MNQSSLIPFVFNTNTIRAIVDSEGNPWFVAVDVCRVIGLGNVSQTLARLDDDETKIIQNPALISNEGSRINDLLNIINESGLYSLVLSSRKPEAKVFKRWVTREVLPSIRKTGQYQMMIRAITDEHGEPWFIAKDVFDTLGIAWNGADSLRKINPTFRMSREIRDPNGRMQETWVIREPAVYKLAWKMGQPLVDSNMSTETGNRYRG